MNPFKVVSRTFSLSLLTTITRFVIVGFLISGAFFYLYTDRYLGETYAERLVNISAYKDTLIKTNIYIYAVFAFVVLVAVALFSIYYSHRVTGPLCRLRLFAKDMADGDFGTTFKFREGDLIHPLSEAANGFSLKYGKMYSELNRVVDEMQKDALELEKSIAENNHEQMNDARTKIAASVEELSRMLSEVRL